MDNMIAWLKLVDVCSLVQQVGRNKFRRKTGKNIWGFRLQDSRLLSWIRDWGAERVRGLKMKGFFLNPEWHHFEESLCLKVIVFLKVES